MLKLLKAGLQGSPQSESKSKSHPQRKDISRESDEKIQPELVLKNNDEQIHFDQES
jgi:hypothetical protein